MRHTLEGQKGYPYAPISWTTVSWELRRLEPLQYANCQMCCNFRECVPLQDVIPVQTECVYWDAQENQDIGSWVTYGCEYVGKMQEHHVCNCTHLTSFAILFVSRRFFFYFSGKQLWLVDIGMRQLETKMWCSKTMVVLSVLCGAYLSAVFLVTAKKEKFQSTKRTINLILVTTAKPD